MGSNESTAPSRLGFAEALHRERSFGALLGFVSGFVDTAGFILLFHLFTAHITGNLVVAAADVTRFPENFISSRISVVFVFVVAVSASTVLATKLREAGHSSIRWLLWCEALALACFAMAGTYCQAALSTDNETLVVTVASLAVAAMAIHITVNKETPYVMGMTNVMTVNLTNFTTFGTRLLMRRRGWWKCPDGEAAAMRERMLHCAAILAGFLVGVTAAGFLVPRFSYIMIYLPVSVIVLLAVTHRDAA